jgi:hypothetical protein
VSSPEYDSSLKRILALINQKEAVCHICNGKKVSLWEHICLDTQWAEYRILQLENDICLVVKPLLKLATSMKRESDNDEDI